MDQEATCMAKRKRRRARSVTRSSRRWVPLAAAVVGVALIGAGLVFANGGLGSKETPMVTGAPRLAVSQEMVDYGEIKVNTPVETVFRVRNMGDQPLRIVGEPQVELVEGC
jgi:membrane protein required for beta-lactamase induction